MGLTVEVRGLVGLEQRAVVGEVLLELGEVADLGVQRVRHGRMTGLQVRRVLHGQVLEGRHVVDHGLRLPRDVADALDLDVNEVVDRLLQVGDLARVGGIAERSDGREDVRWQLGSAS